MNDPSGMDYLDSLLSRREGRHFELKEAKTGFSFDSVCEYVVALSNEGGGDLVLGVKENRQGGRHQIVGTTAWPDINGLEHRIYQRLRINVPIREVGHSDGRVLIIAAPGRSPGEPRHVDGKYLRRSGESLVPMDPASLREILEESRPGQRVMRSGLSEEQVGDLIDTEAFFRLSGDPVPVTLAERVERLERRAVLVRDSAGFGITIDGAVFLARAMSDFEGLEWRRTRVIRYSGTGKVHTVLDRLDERGYALQFEELMELVVQNVPVQEVIEGGRRRDVPFYPPRKPCASSSLMPLCTKTSTLRVLRF